MRFLTLLIPGLLAAGPDWPAPVAPALGMLLARGMRRPVTADHERLLLELFGCDSPAESDPPVAALARLGEGGTPDDGYWLRADPVHLRADLARALLFGPGLLDIAADEAEALVAAFNAQFAADGWRLEAPHPQRWYLRLPEHPGIRTTPLSAALGCDVDALLPHGPNALRWRAVLNEVQMLFHMHDVNRQREEQGRMTINSVWLWGGGTMPRVSAPAFSQVWCDEPLARGLAHAAGLTTDEPPQTPDRCLAGSGGALVVLTSVQAAALYGDTESWRAGIEQLERDWFAPLREALRRGELAGLTLYPGGAAGYHVTRAGLRRFWRRPKPLAAY